MDSVQVDIVKMNQKAILWFKGAYIFNTQWEYLTETYGIKEEVMGMAKVNRNLLAKFITEKEGLKDEVSIAQAKEILSVIFTEHDLEEIVEIWQAYNR